MCEVQLLRYRAAIHRLALRRARHDRDLADDLEQEACIAVWRFDARRVRGSERAIIMRVALDAMRKWLRREGRARVLIPRRQGPPARRPVSAVPETRIVPLRRAAPRHMGAAPLHDRRAA